jgi:hypothetical protein
MNKESLLKLIRKFDQAKHGPFARSTEFRKFFLNSNTEMSNNLALSQIKIKLEDLTTTYYWLWDIYSNRDDEGLDCSCDEKILIALGKRVAPFQAPNGWKAPQYGVELCEYTRLARLFVARGEVDLELQNQLILGFLNLKANLESFGFRFTFERQLYQLELELEESR